MWIYYQETYLMFSQPACLVTGDKAWPSIMIPPT
jgi:hypothetical protein